MTTKPWAAPPVAPVRVLVMMIVALGALEALWLAVSFGSAVPSLDAAVTGGIAAARPAALVVAARLVTDAGSPAVMVTLLVTTVGVLAWRHHTAAPLAVGAGGLAVLTALDLGVKSLVARPRPPETWHAVAAQGWSFPSGHAMFSAGVLLLVAWLLAPRQRRAGLSTAIALGVVIVAVGASRVVLGVHYPSDVLAGWCLALIADGALLLAVALVERRTSRRSSADHAEHAGPSAAATNPTCATLDHRKAA